MSHTFFSGKQRETLQRTAFTSHCPLDKLQMTKLHQSRRFAYHITIEVSEEDQRKTKLKNSSMGFSCKQSTLGRACVDHFFLERAAASPPASNPTAVTAMPMPIIPSLVIRSSIVFLSVRACLQSGAIRRHRSTRSLLFV